MKIITERSFYFALAVTLICSVLGSLLKGLPGLSLIGALVLALLLGMLLQFIPGLHRSTEGGVGFISNKFLRAGIILLGFKLNLPELARAGLGLLSLAALTVLLVIFVNYFIMRRLFRNEQELALLGACGCGICGAAAVMAVSPLVRAKKDNTILAVAVVCIMGTVFTLLEVGLYNSGLLALNAHQYGVMAGSSLHEIAHAVAAGNAGGAQAESIAILAKLSRVLMLVPTAIILDFFMARRQTEARAAKSSSHGTKKSLPIPWFMLGFLAASAAGSYIPFLSGNVSKLLVDLAYILLGMAMAALGLNVNFRVIRERGARIMGAAFCGSVLQLLFCYLMARNFF